MYGTFQAAIEIKEVNMVVFKIIVWYTIYVIFYIILYFEKILLERFRYPIWLVDAPIER